MPRGHPDNTSASLPVQSYTQTNVHILIKGVPSVPAASLSFDRSPLSSFFPSVLRHPPPGFAPRLYQRATGSGVINSAGRVDDQFVYLDRSSELYCAFLRRSRDICCGIRILTGSTALRPRAVCATEPVLGKRSRQCDFRSGET